MVALKLGDMSQEFRINGQMGDGTYLYMGYIRFITSWDIQVVNLRSSGRVQRVDFNKQ